MKGIVKWYNHFKGYGFISGEDGLEVFVHRTALPMGTDIDENDQVEYEIEKSERGPKAMNVKKLKNA
jgi:CspA family cold shock protein